jgi:ABC-type multidrug transport system ATPase subunit
MEMTLDIRSVSKTYRDGQVKALQDVTITLSPGVYGFLGPNGAGKSTLMNIIADNIVADSGEVTFNGAPITQMGHEFRTLLGYMPQQQTLYDEFSANRFLWYFAALKGMSKKEAKVKIESLLDLVSLRAHAHKKLGSFSGGMKQRILIAQALLNDPRILMLDEPTAGLDPRERVRIRNVISEIAMEKIVLLATHVVSDIEYIAKEVIFLQNGQLILVGRPSDILSQFRDKVWQAQIKTDALKEAQMKYTISNILGETNDTVSVKIISDRSPSEYDASPALPTLEDVYLYLFETKSDTQGQAS